MNKKQLWLLVGGNGAGKSTFYKNWLSPLGIPFVNADIIAKELFPDSPEAHSYESAHIAEDMRSTMLLDGRSFCYETVFSHPSKIDFVGKAKAFGYEIIMVFIHLNQVSLNKARVSQRVLLGGHDVPDEKVEHRIPRVLDNVRTAIPLCDQVRLIDNSSNEHPYKTVAIVKKGKVVTEVSPLPNWAIYLLKSNTCF